MGRKDILLGGRNVLAVSGLVISMAVLCVCSGNSWAGEDATATGVQAAKAEQSDCIWITIQDDDGSAETHWGMVGHPSHMICKIIKLDIEPSQIKGAKIRYQIGSDPYYPKLLKKFNKAVEGVKWTDVVITLNGEVVVCKSPLEIATKGWHEISVKPELLKKGNNSIKFSWAKIPEDNPLNASYGYFYMGIDTNWNAGRSCSSTDYGKTFAFDTLRPGSIPEERWQGEYMIRLEIALSKEG